MPRRNYVQLVPLRRQIVIDFFVLTYARTVGNYKNVAAVSLMRIPCDPIIGAYVDGGHTLT